MAAGPERPTWPVQPRWCWETYAVSTQLHMQFMKQEKPCLCVRTMLRWYQLAYLLYIVVLAFYTLDLQRKKKPWALAWNGAPTRWQGCYLRPVMQKTQEKRPTYPAPSKGFVQATQGSTTPFSPLGEFTHLPVSHPFCSCRTYLQGKIPQVTSPPEILTMAIDVISG